jgi:hypothetical protein
MAKRTYTYTKSCDRCRQPLEPTDPSWELGSHIQCWADHFNELYRKREEERKDKLVEPPIDGRDEMMLCALVYYKEVVYTEDGVIDFVQLGFLSGMTHEQALRAVHQSHNRGWLSLRETVVGVGEERRIGYQAKVLLRVERYQLEALVQPVLRSKPVVRIYNKLRKVYPNVFAEQNPAAFLNFRLVKDRLTEQERRWFFTLRFDFVCYSKTFLPLLAVEFHGKQHYVEGYDDSDKRAFKEKICQMAGVEFKQIRGPDDIAGSLRNLEYYAKKGGL